MLVLTRKVGERIVIGENIEITVVQVRGGKVRLGITAPREIPIHRKEVHQRLLYQEDNPNPDTAANRTTVADEAVAVTERTKELECQFVV
jgi:carbon storage regulator